MTQNIRFDKTKDGARGNWKIILSHLGINTNFLENKHGPCPGCGGYDRFRFDDLNGSGSFICSQGTGEIASGDGFELIIHAGITQNKKHALTLVSNAIDESISHKRLGVTEYKYNDPYGRLSHTVFRTDNEDGSKSFKQITARGLSPKQDKSFVWYPYRLDAWVSTNEILYFVEGEKCVEALVGLGVQATCISGGANGWKDSYAQWFKNRHVIIIPDNDRAGLKFAKQVESSLSNIVSSVTLLALPNLEEAGDIVDWIANGGDYEQLQQLVSNTNTIENRTTSLGELLTLEVETRPPLHKYLPSGVTILAGPPKAGKSRFIEIIASLVAEQHRVLYLALEYSIPTAKERFNFISAKSSMKNLTFLLQGEIGFWDQGGAEKLKFLVEKEQPKLIVLDTLSRLKRQSEQGGYEAETRAMVDLKAFADEREIDLLCIHHTRKASLTDNENITERVLGSTALIAVPDNIMVLQRSEKLVTITTQGRLINPSKRTLELIGDQYVEVEGPELELDSRADTQRDIVALLKEGPLLNKEISEKLGLDKGQVSRTMKTLQQKSIVGKDSPASPWKLILGGAFQEQNINSINSVNSGKLFPLDVDEVDKVDGGNDA